MEASLLEGGLEGEKSADPIGFYRSFLKELGINERGGHQKIREQESDMILLRVFERSGQCVKHRHKGNKDRSRETS